MKSQRTKKERRHMAGLIDFNQNASTHADFLVAEDVD